MSETDSLPSVNQYQTPTFTTKHNKTARKYINFEAEGKLTTSSKKRRVASKCLAIKEPQSSKKTPKQTPKNTQKQTPKNTQKQPQKCSTKGKEVIELSSDTSSFHMSEYLRRESKYLDTVDSDEWNLFGPPKSPSYDDPMRVEAINEVQDQIIRDINNADKILPKLGKKKTGDNLRFIYFTVRCSNAEDPGHQMMIIGSVRFDALYDKYGYRQNYKPEDFELWYEGMLLCPELTPDEVGLPEEVTVIVRPKRKGMNLDSRYKVLVLNKNVNHPDGIRLTFMKDDLITTVYDRISGMTGRTLGCFLISCHGKALPETGRLDDVQPKILNEDVLYWMEYPAGFVLPFSK